MSYSSTFQNSSVPIKDSETIKAYEIKEKWDSLLDRIGGESLQDKLRLLEENFGPEIVVKKSREAEEAQGIISDFEELDQPPSSFRIPLFYKQGDNYDNMIILPIASKIGYGNIADELIKGICSSTIGELRPVNGLLSICFKGDYKIEKIISGIMDNGRLRGFSYEVIMPNLAIRGFDNKSNVEVQFNGDKEDNSDVNLASILISLIDGKSVPAMINESGIEILPSHFYRLRKEGKLPRSSDILEKMIGVVGVKFEELLSKLPAGHPDIELFKN